MVRDGLSAQGGVANGDGADRKLTVGLGLAGN